MLGPESYRPVAACGDGLGALKTRNNEDRLSLCDNLCAYHLLINKPIHRTAEEYWDDVPDTLHPFSISWQPLEPGCGGRVDGVTDVVLATATAQEQSAWLKALRSYQMLNPGDVFAGRQSNVDVFEMSMMSLSALSSTQPRHTVHTVGTLASTGVFKGLAVTAFARDFDLHFGIDSRVIFQILGEEDTIEVQNNHKSSLAIGPEVCSSPWSRCKTSEPSFMSSGMGRHSSLDASFDSVRAFFERAKAQPELWGLAVGYSA